MRIRIHRPKDGRAVTGESKAEAKPQVNASEDLKKNDPPKNLKKEIIEKNKVKDKKADDKPTAKEVLPDTKTQKEKGKEAG